MCHLSNKNIVIIIIIITRNAQVHRTMGPTVPKDEEVILTTPTVPEDKKDDDVIFIKQDAARN